MSTKVLVWGLGKGYAEIQNYLKLLEKIGSIDIVEYIDKNPGGTLKPEQITKKIEYEYIIVTTELYYNEIVEYGKNYLNIERSKFLHGKIFKIPNFSWERYMEIYKKTISIIAEACYGGIISNHLGLPFNSPFVNVRIGIEHDDYYKLLNHLDKYMTQSPNFEANNIYVKKNWDGWEGRIQYPKLWYDDIVINGFHFIDEEKLFNSWERRRQRYNKQDRVIFKILYSEQDVEEFSKLQEINKIGFYYRKTNFDNIIWIPFEDNLKYAYQYGTYITHLAKTGEIFLYFNVFKLINGEGNYKELW